MRYVTAMIGAVVVFFSALVIAFVIFAMLPPKLQSDDWTFRTGIFHVRGNPVLVFAPILGLAAAFYSFRDSLKRHRLKAEKKNRVPFRAISRDRTEPLPEIATATPIAGSFGRAAHASKFPDALN
jgi:hypothetical protein